MNSSDFISRLPLLVVMLLLACQAVAAAENLRGSDQTLGMVYYEYDYEVSCHEHDYMKQHACRRETGLPVNKHDIEKKWTQVWVKVQDKNLAISGVLSSYGLFVNYAEGGRLDWSGTLMIGASTFPYTKVDGVNLQCKEEDNVPVNLKFYGISLLGNEFDTWYIDHDTVKCPSQGRLHKGAADSTFNCIHIVNQNTGEYIPTWSILNCYYKTLDDVQAMTRLLTPEQVMSCYGESGWDNDRVC